MQEKKERGGLGLPNFELYHKACNLVWIKEWVLLTNERCLTLEGHDLMEGWHLYIWYNQGKKNLLFKNHLIRSSLMRTWEEVKHKFYEKNASMDNPDRGIYSKKYDKLEAKENI